MFINRPDYDRLPFAIRTGALQLWATLLLERQENGIRYALFSLHDFFAEIGYETRSGRAVGIRTYDTLSQLDTYLDRISLHALITSEPNQ